jgi:uncharacterized repeat protein (TIGR03803 family)
MNRKQFSLSSRLSFVLCLTVLALSIAGAAVAQTVTPLYSFGAPPDAYGQTSAVVFDSAGNAYGTSTQGGANGYGAVFQLTPPATSGGSWTETVIYSFAAGSNNTAGAAGLGIDRLGNLYGTTQFSQNSHCLNSACGTVFKLVRPSTSGGAWTYRLLHGFKGGKTDGSNPISGVVVIGNNVYGTTFTEGPNGGGTVFQITQSGNNFTETLIHSFPSATGDGFNPAGMTKDAAGNLYGVALGGGSNNGGILFKLASSSGTWAESVLLSPDITYGNEPALAPVFDGAGALWGTTQYGGSGNAGTLFRLRPPSTSGGAWTPQLVHSFDINTDGEQPGGLVFDRTSHTLYGMIEARGISGSGGCGYIYQVTQTSGGAWQFFPTFNFSTTNQGLGCAPYLPMTIDASGNLFGVTQTGGTNGDGVAFEFAP